jgi:hypothetical protein
MTKECVVDSHKIFYSNKKDVLYVILGKDHHFGAKAQREYTRIAHEVFKGRASNRNSIIDLSNSKSGLMSKKVRKKLADEIKNNPLPVDKTAMVGATPTVRMFAKVITKLSRSAITNTRFVKSEEEAIEWFNS